MKTRYGRPGKFQASIVLVALAVLAPGSVPADDYEVEAINYRNYESMFFEPDFMKVEPGDRITFLVPDFDHQPQSVFVPAGAEHWKAEKGQPITVTFRHEGLYIHDCAYHNVMGMAGVIQVGKPVNLREARRFYEQYRRETFAMNKDRLDAVWDALGGALPDEATPE